MYTIFFLTPIVVMACADGILSGGRGLMCNFKASIPNTIEYYKPTESCYVNSDFYPDCKDSKSKLVWHYQNLIKTPQTNLQNP
jgi:hypothetical protein